MAGWTLLCRGVCANAPSSSCAPASLHAAFKSLCSSHSPQTIHTPPSTAVGVAAGGITGATPVWREGLSNWDALANVPELAGVLKAAPSSASDHPPTSTTAATGGPAPAAPAAAPTNGTAPRRGALAAAAAPTTSTAAAAAAAATNSDPDDPLAAFQAEISAIEAEADEQDEGAATPSESEFEDDDGTVYVFDRQLRKFVPKDGTVDAAAAGGAAVSQYDVEAMTFAGDDEVLPTLAAVKAAVAAVVEGGEGEGDEAAAANERKVGCEGLGFGVWDWGWGWGCGKKRLLCGVGQKGQW